MPPRAIILTCFYISLCGPNIGEYYRVLGADLPNTEEELFDIENLLIFDINDAKKVLGDDSTLLTNMLKLTINTIPDEIPLLKAAHDNNDWEKVAKISHKLKGGFLSIGLARAATACQYLERYHKAGHTKLLEQLYQQVVKTLDETTNRLKAFVK